MRSPFTNSKPISLAIDMLHLVHESCLSEVGESADNSRRKSWRGLRLFGFLRDYQPLFLCIK